MVVKALTKNIFCRLHRSCKVKKPYSLNEALNKIKEKDKKHLHVYNCHFCGNYHIGHTSKKGRYQARKVLRELKLTMVDIRRGIYETKSQKIPSYNSR